MTGADLAETWPDAPSDERPKNLFVDYTVCQDVRLVLFGRGWKVRDTRILPNKTDADRAEALKAVLEGIRVGTILPDKDRMRWIELEAKVYGLLTGKDKLADTKPKVNPEVLDNLLDFGKRTKV
jgi:hypothetical protein